jgi:hypothetical protein
MYAFGVELTGVAGAHQVFYIGQGGQPIKALPKGFAG